MKVNGIGNCSTINEFVKYKLSVLDDKEKNFENLYPLMFSEKENVMAERTDGHRIIKTTYGECEKDVKRIADNIAFKMAGCEKHSIVGMYMQNSIRWIEIFWALIMSGYKPLLMNTRLDEDTLNKVIEDYNVSAVISDGKQFNTVMYAVEDITEDCQAAESEPRWEDEIIVMSSGTSEIIKLCVYTGEKFYYQVCDSVSIVKDCKEIKRHYEGNLKLLTFLPFYHIFGLAAMYMWFAFFSRTFVFLNDLGADTILNTVRKHKVTHIFSVPLLWNKVYEAAIKKIRERGDKTYNKFQMGMKIVEKCSFCPPLQRKVSKLLFKEVRANIFGESICFLISGGSMISSKVLGFFNGIGYHIADGYGMSEIGITSVEASNNLKVRNSCSVGKPFNSIEYSINENGELLVRGKSTASVIIKAGEKYIMDESRWFNTHDMAVCSKGRYYITGRQDDMIACKNGENLNPNRIEGLIKIEGAHNLCLVARNNKLDAVTPVLIIEVSRYLSGERISEILENARKELASLKLDSVITEIVITTDTLMGENDFKLNRHKIAKAYMEGRLKAITPETIKESEAEVSEELLKELAEIFANALSINPEEVGYDAHFFFELDGSSLDYLSMLAEIQNRYNVTLSPDAESTPSTVREFCIFIQNNI